MAHVSKMNRKAEIETTISEETAALTSLMCGGCYYPTIDELFADIKGNPNPDIVDILTTLCTRETTCPALSFNGGDYSYFLHRKDMWAWETDSSDFCNEIVAIAGYYCGVPFILVG
jgi:hypothetical protein